MPDPKSYGAPTGVEKPITTGRTQPRQLSDAQVKAAYKAYMGEVVKAAHEHFHTTLGQATGQSPSTGRPTRSTMSDALGTSSSPKTIRRTDEAVDSMSK